MQCEISDIHLPHQMAFADQLDHSGQRFGVGLGERPDVLVQVGEAQGAPESTAEPSPTPEETPVDEDDEDEQDREDEKANWSLNSDDEGSEDENSQETFDAFNPEEFGLEAVEHEVELEVESGDG